MSANLSPLRVEVAGGQLPEGYEVVQGAGANATNVYLWSPSVLKPGNYNFTLKATDSTGESVTHDFTIKALGLADDTDIDYPDAVMGDDYFWAFTADGGTGPYRFIAQGNWNIGLTLSEDGEITGTPLDYGLKYFQFILRDSAGAQCIYNLPVIIHAGPGEFHGCKGLETSSELSAKGLTGAITWTPNNMPDWLTATNPQPGKFRMTGTPPAPGTYSWTVTAQDSEVPPNIQVFQSICDVVGITDDLSLPYQAYVGTPFSLQLHPVGGSTTPQAGEYTFYSFLGGGSLPPGLTMDQHTGLVSGTPTTAGSWSLALYVKDWTNFGCSIGTLTITVSAPLIDWTQLTWDCWKNNNNWGDYGWHSECTGGQTLRTLDVNSGSYPGQVPPPGSVPWSRAVTAASLWIPQGTAPTRTRVTVTLESQHGSYLPGGPCYGGVQINGHVLWATPTTGGVFEFTATPGNVYTFSLDAYAIADYVATPAPHYETSYIVESIKIEALGPG